MKNKITFAMFIVLFLCFVCKASTICYYIDPDATGNHDGGRDGADPNDPSQEANWTDAWTTGAAAETALDGTFPAAHTLRLYFRATSGTDDTAKIYYYEWSNAVNVEMVGYDFPTEGVWDSSKYVIHVTDDECIVPRSIGNLTITNMQIYVTASTTEAHAVESYTSWSGTLTIDGCIIKGDGAAGTARGVFGDGGIVVIKNSVIECQGYANVTENCTSMTVQNCVLTGGATYSNRQTSGTYTATNTISFNNNDDWHGTITATYCASDETKSGTGNIDWNNGATDWAANFTNYAAGDYTPVLDSSIYHAGSDLDFALDLAGNSWHATTPSIGAFEYLAESPPALTGNSPRIYIIN